MTNLIQGIAQHTKRAWCEVQSVSCQTTKQNPETRELMQYCGGLTVQLLYAKLDEWQAPAEWCSRQWLNFAERAVFELF